MQAYASTEMAQAAELRFLDPRPPSSDGGSARAATGAVVLDELLGQLANLVADRLANRLEAPQADAGDEWLDTRRAAEYLGIHRDSLRRLAAERSIPMEQAGTGCKLFFRRTDLVAWRRGGRARVIRTRSKHDG